MFMARWSRPLGLIVSSVVLLLLLALGLTGTRVIGQVDPRNGQAFIQDNLWSARSYQYAVWVAPNGTPFAGRRRRGARRWEVFDLSKLPGNPLGAPTARDDHNVYAIATDAEGGTHIAGNMHGNPLRYVRSGRGGFGTWTDHPAPGVEGSLTYPAFTALPDGTLLFFTRVGSAGRGAVLLDALAPGASRWRSLGTVLDGAPSRESPYLNHIAVDPRSGTIHLLFEWRSGDDPSTTNDVGYARSVDGGRTWQRSDGTPLRLPVTHAGAERVIDTRPTGSGLLNNGGLTVDSHGRPHGVVVFGLPRGREEFEHVWLQGGAWRHEVLTDVDLGGRPQLVGTPDGRVWLLGSQDSAIEAIDITPGRRHAPSRTVYRGVPAGWEVSYDSEALARYGAVEMLIPLGDRPHVVTARLGDR